MTACVIRLRCWCVIFNLNKVKKILAFVTVCLVPCLLQANVEEEAISQYGSLVLSIVITTVFLIFIFLVLIMINKIYRKKALVKIKRALENDID